MPVPRRRALACTAALAAVLANAVPALATALPAPSNAPLIATSPVLANAQDGLRHGTSTNWSGYIATSTNGTKFTSVTSHWTQPAVTCTDQDTYSSFWVGLDGAVSKTVEQTGSSADCSSGQPVYYSWYEMYPAYPVNFYNAVAPGDQFTASVTTNGKGSFTLKLSDTTQHWTHTVNKTLLNAELSSAEVIAEAPSTTSGPLPLSNFGTVDFSSATANGQPIGAFNPENVTMARQGRTLAATSPLSAGNAFSVTWKSSN
ncbi:G1 family glutamic endopeptidase [Kitasatospora sp. NBC_01302]|uniref:G1 family glutamic endopeptidase n=1 Tax=Kitasatospora sp. NBC_01302 TaxID=2903575 RepID=UPI002E147E2B|nr:G1 family endopeptidase [Kitasatospora sp. NBC_01302]